MGVAGRGVYLQRGNAGGDPHRRAPPRRMVAEAIRRSWSRQGFMDKLQQASNWNGLTRRAQQPRKSHLG
jgi:hypothetical protein